LKSTDSALKKRGMTTKEEIEDSAELSFEQLLKLLQDRESSKRSAAAINLALYVDKAADELLEQLAKEKCLYTRIAICETLEKGNIDTARKMTKYLGRIGNNQHKSLPEKVSAKKSFPLPRDLIARSIGKMDISTFPAIVEVLSGGDLIQILEALDAFGYMIFYNPILADGKNCKFLIELGKCYENEPILLWKVILCMSAFSQNESIDFLQHFVNDQSILGMEAKRSLNILAKNL